MTVEVLDLDYVATVATVPVDTGTVWGLVTDGATAFMVTSNHIYQVDPVAATVTALWNTSGATH